MMKNCITERDRLVGELHYACKQISDEAFGYVLRIAKSLAADRDSGVPLHDRLVERDFCLITGPDTAVLRRFWSFDGEVFLSNTYRRLESGRWVCDEKDTSKFGPKWAVQLEDSFQQKKREVCAAAVQEQN